MLHFRNTNDDSLVSHSGTVGSHNKSTVTKHSLYWSTRCACISTWSSRWQVRVQVQILTLQVQVRVQVLWICTGVQLDYKYKYQVLHLWLIMIRVTSQALNKVAGKTPEEVCLQTASENRT